MVISQDAAKTKPNKPNFKLFAGWGFEETKNALL